MDAPTKQESTSQQFSASTSKGCIIELENADPKKLLRRKRHRDGTIVECQLERCLINIENQLQKFMQKKLAELNYAAMTAVLGISVMLFVLFLFAWNNIGNVTIRMVISVGAVVLTTLCVFMLLEKLKVGMLEAQNVATKTLNSCHSLAQNLYGRNKVKTNQVMERLDVLKEKKA
jgi:hypothetical protein